MFKRTNGYHLAPNRQGQRVVTIAPTVKAVRLRVESPTPNKGVLELDAGNDTEECRQSIGATANDRATWRGELTSPDPLTAGDHLVRISVRNDIGSAEVALVVRVSDTAPAFETARRGAQTFTVGSEARFRFGKATGGNGALTYGMDAVPDGMAFDADRRTLSGTPRAAAAATDYTCTVTDADGDEAEQVVSITVVAAWRRTTPCPALPGAGRGSAARRATPRGATLERLHRHHQAHVRCGGSLHTCGSCAVENGRASNTHVQRRLTTDQ